MRWTLGGEQTGIGEMAGSTVISVYRGGDHQAVVDLEGPTELVREAADLIREASAAREKLAAQISGGRLEYFVTFIGPAGFGSMSVETPAPGIETYEHVLRLQAGLSKEFQGPVAILNWRQLRSASRVLAPVPSGIVVAPS